MPNLVLAIHVYQRTDGRFLVYREDIRGHLVGGFADEETTDQIKGWLDEPLQEVQPN
jgi:hypothetical protein